MNAYTTQGWESFFVAEAGAAAALAGLLFVAVSINLGRILSIHGLSGRAAEALLILFCVITHVRAVISAGVPLAQSVRLRSVRELMRAARNPSTLLGWKGRRRRAWKLG